MVCLAYRRKCLIQVLCRFRVLHMSEAPVLRPLIPLGIFITQLGAPPPEEGLRIYLRRMREQGFDVSNVLQALVQSKAPVACEVLCCRLIYVTRQETCRHGKALLKSSQRA